MPIAGLYARLDRLLKINDKFLSLTPCCLGGMYNPSSIHEKECVTGQRISLLGDLEKHSKQKLNACLNV